MKTSAATPTATRIEVEASAQIVWAWSDAAPARSRAEMAGQRAGAIAGRETGRGSMRPIRGPGGVMPLGPGFVVGSAVVGKIAAPGAAPAAAEGAAGGAGGEMVSLYHGHQAPLVGGAFAQTPAQVNMLNQGLQTLPQVQALRIWLGR